VAWGRRSGEKERRKEEEKWRSTDRESLRESDERGGRMEDASVRAYNLLMLYDG
jgi:hypothetical protein